MTTTTSVRIPSARWILLSALLFAVGAAPQFAGAEDPKETEITGVYHCDRWGIGSIGNTPVAPGLNARLAEFEGRRVKLTVAGPGPQNEPPYVSNVTDAHPTDESPVKVRMTTQPDPVTAGSPFRITCTFHNTGDVPVRVTTDQISLSVLGPRPTRTPTRPARFPPGYTEGQLSKRVGERLNVYGALIKAAGEWGGELSWASAFMVGPGERFPAVVIVDRLTNAGAGLGVGGYEISVAATADRGGHAFPPSQAWLKLDVRPGPARAAPPDPGAGALRVSDVKVADAGEGEYTFSFRVRPPADGVGRLVQAQPDDRPESERFWQGRVRAVTADGASVPLSSDRQTRTMDHTGLWKLYELPTEGTEVRGGFRKATRFPSLTIRRLYLDLLTGEGLQEIPLTDALTDTDVHPDVPFGPEACGVKLRVRPVKEVFKTGERPRFHVQAVNVSGKPLVWHHSISKVGGFAAISIDGKAVEGPAEDTEWVEGWAKDSLCRIPLEWSIELPATAPKLAAGSHVVRYTLLAQDWEFTNYEGTKVPVLSAPLASNEVNIEVRD